MLFFGSSITFALIFRQGCEFIRGHLNPPTHFAPFLQDLLGPVQLDIVFIISPVLSSCCEVCRMV